MMASISAFSGLNPPSSILSIVIVLGIGLLIWTGGRSIQHRRHARPASALGCKPITRKDNGWTLGLPQVMAALKASRSNIFPPFIVERMQDARTIESTFMEQRRIFTRDPQNIKAILATQFKEFGLGNNRNHNFGALLGHGIFSSDGSRWEESRALLRPQFARAQISDLALEETHVQNLIQILMMDQTDSKGWTATINLQELFFRLTLDSATEFLFGTSMDTQLEPLRNKSLDSTEAKKQQEKSFAYNFDRALKYLSDGTKLGHYYWLAHTATFREARDRVHQIVDSYVQIGLNRKPEATNETPERYIFLNALVKQTQNPILIRDELLSILLAGRDTTASLLSWTFQLLAQYPATYSKLRGVVLQEFGTYDRPANLSFESLKSCVYLQQVLNESLRLFPVVPINFRRCIVSHTTLPSGGGDNGLHSVYVREGDEVVYSVHAMQRSPELWGEDAHLFRPDRWAGRKPGWDYLPFNGGPRICIGQQFALTEAGYVIVRLLQRFDDIQGSGVPPIGLEKHDVSLTNCPADGEFLRLKEAVA